MEQNLETPVVITAEILKQIDASLAEIGHTYHPDFIGSLNETAIATLTDWLKANNAPQEVLDMIEDVILLDRVALGLIHNQLGDWDASELPGLIGRVSTSIIRLGGSFSGAGSIWGDHTPIEWKRD